MDILLSPSNSIIASRMPSPILPLKILVFSWNTKSIRLSNAAGEQSWSYLPTFSKGEDPDFFEAFIEYVKKHDPQIIVIGFQEDACPGSHFHSQYLPNKMPAHGYYLLRRSKMIGVGITTYKALRELDIKARGLRTSLYVQGHLLPKVTDADKTLESNIGSLTKEYICAPTVFRGKGASAIYLQIPTHDNKLLSIAFINTHLPFNSKGLMQSHMRNNPIIRQNDVFIQNVCFNRIHESLVLDLPMRFDYIFYFGDFNYRLKGVPDAVKMANCFEESYRNGSANEALAAYQKIYLEHDELYDQMSKQLIYKYSEGKENIGPMFLPTCKLHKNRYQPYGIFRTGLNGQRSPSWTDRILYSLNSNTFDCQCLDYDRFDVGTTMKLSDHGAILGLFEISLKRIINLPLIPNLQPLLASTIVEDKLATSSIMSHGESFSIAQSPPVISSIPTNTVRITDSFESIKKLTDSLTMTSLDSSFKLENNTQSGDNSIFYSALPELPPIEHDVKHMGTIPSPLPFPSLPSDLDSSSSSFDDEPEIRHSVPERTDNK